MQLNQPIPPAPSGGHDQYDFILANNQKPKGKLAARSGSKKSRFIIAGAGAAILLVIFGIVFNLLSSSGGDAKAQILVVAQTQNEIARVATLGSVQAKDLGTQAFAKTVAVSMTTGVSQTTGYLNKYGKKVDSKVLVATKDSKTDQALKTAAESNVYDQKLVSVLNEELTEYQKQLIKAYKSASTPTQKKLLQDLSDQASTLTKNQPVTN